MRHAARFRLAGKLLFNAVRYQILKKISRPGPIQALSLEITHQCICRCIMCNIWKIPRNVPELDISDWSHLLGDPLLSDLIELDITGGEPFLKKNLPLLFKRIARLTRHHLKLLKSVAITTNGVLTQSVLSSTQTILDIMKETPVQLVVVCAMDATGQCHDEIRNHPGAYRKLQATLSGLMNLRTQYPKLILGLKTTIVPENIDQLSNIQAFAEQHGFFTIISPCIVTGGRYLNKDSSTNLAFSTLQKRKMIDFYCQADLAWRHHAATVLNVLRTEKSKKPCTCGFNYAFVRSTGRIHLCPLLADSAGTLAKQSLSTIWHSAAAKKIRNRIGKADICQSCTEPGLERYALYFEGWRYFRLCLQLNQSEFECLHNHLGLSGYR